MGSPLAIAWQAGQKNHNVKMTAVPSSHNFLLVLRVWQYPTNIEFGRTELTHTLIPSSLDA